MHLFKNHLEYLGLIICVASAIIFGLYPPAARAVYQDGGNITFVILVATACRLVGLYIFALTQKLSLFNKFEDYKLNFYAGVFQALSIIGLLAGSFFIPGAVVVIIMFSYSLMLLLFSAWRKEVRLNKVNICSTLCALMGLFFVLNISNQGTSYPLAGILLALLAAFATFSRTYIFGKQRNHRHPIAIGVETFVVAFICLLPLMFWQLPQPPSSNIGYIMMLISALSLTIGSYGMFYGISYLGAYKFSMIMKLEPIFTTLFGIILIGDFLQFSQYFGIFLVLMSLVSLQLFDKQNT